MNKYKSISTMFLEILYSITEMLSLYVFPSNLQCVLKEKKKKSGGIAFGKLLEWDKIFIYYKKLFYLFH